MSVELRKFFESLNPDNPVRMNHAIHMATCFNIINGHDDEEKVIEVQHEEIDEDEYPLCI